MITLAEWIAGIFGIVVLVMCVWLIYTDIRDYWMYGRDVPKDIDDDDDTDNPGASGAR